MKRFVALALVLVECLPSLAESLRLEGEAFRPGATPIEWKAKTDKKALWIYRAIPQNFPMGVISNAMAVGSFKSLDIVNPNNKKLLRFQDRKRNETRYLEISSEAGRIRYYDSTGTSDMISSVEAVPNYKEIERLGLDLLQQLGIDRTHIALGPRPTGESKRSQIIPIGKEQNIEVQARHMRFVRQIDGISFTGDGLWIEFGSKAKIAQFDLTWPNLIPHELHQVATVSEMLDFIRIGKAVCAMDTKGEFRGATNYTAKSLTVHYLGQSGTDAPDMIYPFASLKIEAAFPTNRLEFELACPILSTSAWREPPKTSGGVR